MWGGSNAGLAIEGRPTPPGPLPEIGYFAVSEDYFKTLRVPLHRGRSLERTDRLETPGVVVVNEAAARRFWPGASPIGARVRLGPDPSQPWSEVVGVVGDMRQYGLDAEPRPAAYLSQRQDAWTHMIVLVRSTAPPQVIDERARSALRELDPALALSNVHPLEEIVGFTLARQRFAMSLLSVFGSVALVLAIVGVYGIVSYDVALRRREFGVRVALGALPRQVLSSVLRQTIVIAGVGLGLGAAGALAVTGFLRGLLYGVEPTDPATLSFVLLALLVASLAASSIPARRATRANPVDVLRND
jgi:predicted permease